MVDWWRHARVVSAAGAGALPVAALLTVSGVAQAQARPVFEHINEDPGFGTLVRSGDVLRFNGGLEDGSRLGLVADPSCGAQRLMPQGNASSLDTSRLLQGLQTERLSGEALTAISGLVNALSGASSLVGALSEKTGELAAPARRSDTPHPGDADELGASGPSYGSGSYGSGSYGSGSYGSGSYGSGSYGSGSYGSGSYGSGSYGFDGSGGLGSGASGGVLPLSSASTSVRSLMDGALSSAGSGSTALPPAVISSLGALLPSLGGQGGGSPLAGSARAADGPSGGTDALPATGSALGGGASALTGLFGDS